MYVDSVVVTMSEVPVGCGSVSCEDAYVSCLYLG